MTRLGLVVLIVVVGGNVGWMQVLKATRFGGVGQGRLAGGGVSVRRGESLLRLTVHFQGGGHGVGGGLAVVGGGGGGEQKGRRVLGVDEVV